jgi:glycosyltransferase involved in cell wall biosynthesis
MRTDSKLDVKVCYVLSYYSPHYVRTRTLLAALRRIDHVVLYEAVNTTPSFWRYFQTLLRLIGVRLRHRPEIYILGFRGHEIYWLVRMLTFPRRLIFDQMMSPYDSLVNETKKLRQGSVLERLAFWYERSILKSATAVLTDTSLHRQYFSELFHVAADKIHAIPVGTDEELFRPNTYPARKDRDDFLVLYYGSFLPLHGIDVILEAAAQLKNLPIRFLLIGGNRLDLSDFHARCSELGLENVEHRVWVEFEELPELIAQADLCLGGPFGGTGQARHVITGKTFQFLALGKPTVVGVIDQLDGFVDRANCLLVTQGEPKELANAISWAFGNRNELPSIGNEGKQLFLERFSLTNVSLALKEAVCQ